MKTYSVEGLSFEAPESGIVVEKCGLRFHSVKLVGADPTAWFDLVVSSKEATDRIPGDKMEHFKMTFLGAQEAPTKRVSRQFGARSLEGDLHVTDFPFDAHREIFRFDLPDGGLAALSFGRADAFDAAAAEVFFAQIASTLRADRA
jgi:hypothetical protein